MCVFLYRLISMKYGTGVVHKGDGSCVGFDPYTHPHGMVPQWVLWALQHEPCILAKVYKLKNVELPQFSGWESHVSTPNPDQVGPRPSHTKL